MLTTRTSDHIRSKGNLRGRHSCRTATGVPMKHIDEARLAQQETALSARVLRRAWLDRLWKRHQAWCRQLGRA